MSSGANRLIPYLLSWALLAINALGGARRWGPATNAALLLFFTLLIGLRNEVGADWEEWYRNSKFVVAPIFDGSGMKTKVAEALMYGKKIVGTPEAFVGYEATLPRSGWCCRSPDAFLNACNAAEREVPNSVNEALIEVFDKKYSITAAERRFSQILV